LGANLSSLKKRIPCWDLEERLAIHIQIIKRVQTIVVALNPHLTFVSGFALECRALARVRDIMGLINVIVMVPFVRTTQEAEKVFTFATHSLMSLSEHINRFLE
jgi:hypothetical protein